MTRNHRHNAMTSISKTKILARTGLFGAFALGGHPRSSIARA